MSKYNSVSILEVLEGADNYNRWIAETVMKYIEPPVLEIGSGIGNISAFLLDKPPVVLSDADPELVSHLRKRFSNHKKSRIERIDITKKCSGKSKQSFNSIVGINVLEHIERDDIVLENLSEYLESKGRLILLVPSKKFAYTKLDKNLGHFRRYEKKELVDKLTASGYAVEKIFFFNIVGLLSWIIRDKMQRKNIHLEPGQVAIFDSIVPVLKVIESIITVPVGISLIAVATKIT